MQTYQRKAVRSIRGQRETALDKLQRKKLDLIVGNDVSRSDAGFGVDTNIVTMLGADGQIETTPKLLKDEVGDVILNRLIALRAAKTEGRNSAPRVVRRK